MLTYHNNPATKDKYLQRMAAHIAADNLRQGDTERCAIGCTLDGLYSHDGMAKELGWPLWLVYWYEHMFEGLPASDGPEFCMSILSAIPVGAGEQETERWRHAIAVRRLRRLLESPQSDEVRAAIEQVIAYHANSDRTETMRFEAELAALSAARSARSVADAVWAEWEDAEATWEAALAAESVALSAAAWSVTWSALSAVQSAAISAKLAAWASADAATDAARSAALAAEYRAQWRDFLDVVATKESE